MTLTYNHRNVLENLRKFTARVSLILVIPLIKSIGETLNDIEKASPILSQKYQSAILTTLFSEGGMFKKCLLIKINNPQ